MLVMPVSSPPCPEKMVQGNYLCTRTYDTGASFELIFMKFTCLVRVHPWVNPIVFGNNQPNRIADVGENVAPKPAFWLSFSRDGIFYGINFFVVRRLLCLKNGRVPQNFFCGYFEKYVFFFLKKLFNEKYFKPPLLPKRLY